MVGDSGIRHTAVAIAALCGSFQRLRCSSALPGAPKTQSCETNNANTRAQQQGGLSQICASFRLNPCSTHGCLNQATASAAPNLAAQLPAPGRNPYGMSTPRGHAGAFTKRTWFYTTRLASSLPGCPGSDDEANTIRASRTQRLSTQKKGPALAQVRRQGLAHHRWIALKLFRSQLPKYLSANALTEPKVLFLRGNSNSAAFDAHSTCLTRPSTKPATAVSTQDSGKAGNSPPRGKESFPALPVTGHKL